MIVAFIISPPLGIACSKGLTNHVTNKVLPIRYGKSFAGNLDGLDGFKLPSPISSTQRAIQVGYDILYRFDTYGKSHEVRRDARRPLLLVGEL